VLKIFREVNGRVPGNVFWNLSLKYVAPFMSVEICESKYRQDVDCLEWKFELNLAMDRRESTIDGTRN
jgi:hypothetical protein